MTNADLIAAIARQEENLILEHFDEAIAFDIGTALRARALDAKAPVVSDIRSAARRYFFTALPGSTPDNEDWARRKANTVLRCHKSSMRVGLEHAQAGRAQWPDAGLHHGDFVTHGGAFPITVRQLGVVACIAVSGLPSLDDHELATATLADHLGLDGVALPR